MARPPGIPATLLPPPNTQTYISHPHRSATELRDAIIPFLDKVQISHSDPSSIETRGDEHLSSLVFSARGNTWSRAARRKLQLQRQQGSSPAEDQPISLRATLRFLDGSIEIDWTYGSDRADIDSLWKSMLANSGLVDRASGRTLTDITTGDKRSAEVDEKARKEIKISASSPTLT